MLLHILKKHEKYKSRITSNLGTESISVLLDAPSHLYKRSCPFVRPSVGPSVRPVLFLKVKSMHTSCTVYLALFLRNCISFRLWALVIVPPRLQRRRHFRHYFVGVVTCSEVQELAILDFLGPHFPYLKWNGFFIRGSTSFSGFNKWTDGPPDWPMKE